jgi:hypothetical protein
MPTPRRTQSINYDLSLKDNKVMNEDMITLLSKVSSQVDSLRYEFSEVRANALARPAINKVDTPNPLPAPATPTTPGGGSKKKFTFSRHQSGVSALSNDSSDSSEEDADAVDDMRTVKIGDIICLRVGDTGIMFGNSTLGRVGVEKLEDGQSRGCGSVRSDSIAFRICPKLNYRTKREFDKMNHQQDASTNFDQHGVRGV